MKHLLMIFLFFQTSLHAMLSPAFAETQASGLSFQCSLSGRAAHHLDGCPNDSTDGYLTSTTAIQSDGKCTANSAPYCSVLSSDASAVPVHVWGICRWIDSYQHALFVPFKTSVEWTSFLAAAPGLAGVTLYHCGAPYSVTNAPSTASVTPPYANCSATIVNTPNVFGRTGVSLWPYPALQEDFTCHDGSTLVESNVQWIAGDADVTANGSPSWSPLFSFSPDVVLKATDTSNGSSSSTSITVNAGTVVKLNWTTRGRSGQIWTCTASGSWNGSKAPAGGTQIILPAANGLYNISCTDTDNLTSTTAVAVNVVASGTACVSANGADGSDGSSLYGGTGGKGGTGGTGICGTGGAGGDGGSASGTGSTGGGGGSGGAGAYGGQGGAGGNGGNAY